MNATASMIAMLGYSEVDTGVSDIGVETMESDNCREVSGDDKDVNGVLAAT